MNAVSDIISEEDIEKQYKIYGGPDNETIVTFRAIQSDAKAIFAEYSQNYSVGIFCVTDNKECAEAFALFDD